MNEEEITTEIETVSPDHTAEPDFKKAANVVAGLETDIAGSPRARKGEARGEKVSKQIEFHIQLTKGA